MAFDGMVYSGKALLDYIDKMAQNAYFLPEDSPEKKQPEILCGICGAVPNLLYTARIK